MMRNYGGSKLLLVMAVAKVAEFVRPEHVIVNMVNPGMCRGTEIGRDLGAFMVKFMMPMVSLVLGRSLAAGASTYLDAALLQGDESHGSYCSDWTIKPYVSGCLYPPPASLALPPLS